MEAKRDSVINTNCSLWSWKLSQSVQLYGDSSFWLGRKNVKQFKAGDRGMNKHRSSHSCGSFWKCGSPKAKEGSNCKTLLLICIFCISHSWFGVRVPSTSVCAICVCAAPEQSVRRWRAPGSDELLQHRRRHDQAAPQVQPDQSVHTHLQPEQVTIPSSRFLHQ